VRLREGWGTRSFVGGEEWDSQLSRYPMSENPDMGHPAPDFEVSAPCCA